jgi:hypothetical protein
LYILGYNWYALRKRVGVKNMIKDIDDMSREEMLNRIIELAESCKKVSNSFDVPEEDASLADVLQQTVDYFILCEDAKLTESFYLRPKEQDE